MANDILTTVEVDAEKLYSEIVVALKSVEATVLTDVNAFLAGLKQGKFALPLTSIAALLQDASAAAAAIEKDAAAVVPANVVAFLNSKGTLDSVIVVPFAGKTLTSIHYLGTKEQLVAAVAAGMPL